MYILPFMVFLNCTGQELSSKNKTYEYTGESDEEEGIETTLELRGVSPCNL